MTCVSLHTVCSEINCHEYTFASWVYDHHNFVRFELSQLRKLFLQFIIRPRVSPSSCEAVHIMFCSAYLDCSVFPVLFVNDGGDILTENDVNRDPDSVQ